MHLLEELGISSPQEAVELERDLGISFNNLTPDQRETWKQQTVYLGLYAETGTYTRSARAVGITVRTVRTWQSENTLGFNDRLELAVLEYSEGIDLMLLQHVRKPDCSPSLLMMFVRAQFPEKYGPVRRDNAPRNTNRCDHQCEHDPLPPPTSRYDLQLLEEISRDLQNLKQFARLSEPSNLSPAGGEIQRGGTPTPTDHEPVRAGFKPAHDPSGPSVESPSTPSPVLGEGWGEGESSSTQHQEPNTQNLTRRQRRELQRRAKRQKSHLARAPN